MDTTTKSLQTIDFAQVKPEDVIDNIRRVAQSLHEDVADLQSTWQSKDAGKVWSVFAKGLEKMADDAEKCWKSL